ncbi:MAG: hypothetical protein JO035_08230 [Betaproteobacteria bacterium]|nr:hypothetical protein [Betaproteobacteria bacterium]
MPAAPAYPRNENLIKFFVTSASEFQYFIDRASIVPDGAFVRYVLVARSPSGADNVSFEMMNCHEPEYRSLARGAAEGKWVERPTPWRKIDGTQRGQLVLYRDFFCPNGVPVHTVAEAVNALQRGGHPWATRPNTQGLTNQPNAR